MILSLSGSFLLVFLTLHLALNLTALRSRELYDAVCAFMDESFLVQLMVPVLAFGFIFHILFSFWIELNNWSARSGARYLVPTKTKASSWASKHMFALGMVILGFLVLHFCHFWAKMQLQHMLGNKGANAYDLLIQLFSQWQYCVLYVIWLGAVYFHISHGLWSAFHSIGMDNVHWIPRLKFLGRLYGGLLFLAYSAIPFYFFFGFYK